MVVIPLPDAGSFCIDSTEVTRADYQAFVDAEPSLSLQPACCSWNTSYYKPPATPLPGPDDVPAVFVNWCDAAAYCAWAGKRLCGKIGGGSLTGPESVDPMASQWLYACTQGGLKKFPYGSSADDTACVTFDHKGGAQQLEPVGTAPGCVGGFPGLFDMSGNAGEWDDSAVVAECGETDLVAMRGGSYGNIAEEADCAMRTSTTRLTASNLGGFRCCKD
jgi:formylglycine-generating enzyme required for sulfatase activity